MIDREKVIKGLKCHLAKKCECEKDVCPYWEDYTCAEMLLNDALELLEEQDKTIESLTKERERLLLERIAELQHNINALHATMQDTIFVNNAIEQRKAVKWA